MHHTFNINIAEQFNVNVAIFMNSLCFWIQKNAANNKHFHDGTYWTLHSLKGFTNTFPYWTEKQIRTIISHCDKFELIKKANFNTNKFDKTTWYSLTKKAERILGISIIPLENTESLKLAQHGEKQDYDDNPTGLPSIDWVKNYTTKRI